MNCKNCGAPIPIGVSYCGYHKCEYCGTGNEADGPGPIIGHYRGKIVQTATAIEFMTEAMSEQDQDVIDIYADNVLYASYPVRR